MNNNKIQFTEQQFNFKTVTITIGKGSEGKESDGDVVGGDSEWLTSWLTDSDAAAMMLSGPSHWKFLRHAVRTHA